jgi:hypothetical protein
MDAFIRVPEVGTIQVQTRITLRGVLLSLAPFTFHLSLRRHVPVDAGRFQPYLATAVLLAHIRLSASHLPQPPRLV